MLAIPYVDGLEVDGRAVFMRVDFNVPRDKETGAITDRSRIEAALPTIRHLLDGGARLALASHLGRPKGSPSPKLSLEPVGESLSELLGRDVLFSDDCVGDGVLGLMNQLQPGQVLLLENLRFHKGETKNDEDFARRMARPFDVYVNEAFGTMHRAHASTAGMVPHVKERAAGFLVKKEIEFLTPLLEKPRRPFRAVLGGAKVSDKLGVIRNLLGKVDTVLVGGAMAYTFLRARGVKVGDSRVEADMLGQAKEALARADAYETHIYLPSDHVVASSFSEDAQPEVVEGIHIPEGKMGLDIGPQTAEAYTKLIAEAQTLFWNGPMGVFEWDAFKAGTQAVARAMVANEGYTVAGGGDSVAALNQLGGGGLTHISTGGGASLEFLEGKELPGLKALTE